MSYPPPLNEQFQHRKYAVLRAVQRALGGDSERDWSTCGCMRNVTGNAVSVVRSSVAGRAHLQGLVTCGSVWTCPVCAVKISARRGEEIKHILETSTSTKVLITYTLQHRRSDRLSTLLTNLKKAISYARSGSRKARLDQRYNIEGYIRAFEIRHNEKTGWHPHAHEVLLCDVPEREIDTEQLEKDLTTAYRRKLEQLGYHTNGFTVDVSIVESTATSTAGAKAAEYITKQAVNMSLELAAGQEKKSKGNSLSPFQLIAAFMETGDLRYTDLFHEYAEATYRKNIMNFSRGLKAKYDVEEVTDEELAGDEKGEEDTTICTIDRENWKRVLMLGLVAQLIIEASTKPDSVIDWLEQHKIRAELPKQFSGYEPPPPS